MVLEFGSGFSTSYFDRKGAIVISYEREKYWILKLRPMISARIDLRHFKDDTQDGDDDYFNAVIRSLRATNTVFDVLVVDVFPRPKTFELFAELVSDSGFIIFDNSDWYPEFFTELKSRNDLLIVDFYGKAIGGIKDQCTSIIFKRENIFFSQRGGASKFTSGVISTHDRPLSWKD